jgi:integrase
MGVSQMFRRADRKAWYCKVDRKFVRLHTDRKVARAEWERLIAEHDDSAGPVPTVRKLLKDYFAWLTSNRAGSTCKRRKWVLQSFSREHGTLKSSTIKPHHVTMWVDHHWGDRSSTTRSDHIMMIQAAYSWGVRQGHLRYNPLARMEKPTRHIREDFVPVEDWGSLLNYCRPPFDDLVRFVLLAGARPQEVRIIEAQHVKDNTIVLQLAHSKGRRRNRVIHLSVTARELVGRLCDRWPEGRIFRNEDGEPWTRYALNCRMKRLKAKTGWKWLTMTSLRHSFAHAQVAAGTDALILQQLMGHRDGRMLATVYAHADKASDQISQALDATSRHLVCGPDPPVECG